jgi:CBS domain containing-hemolysin-like protein
MVPQAKLTMIDLNAAWPDVLRTVSGTSFSRIPAYRGSRDQVVGTLRVKDLVHRYVADGHPVAVDSLLRPFAKVPHNLPGDQVIALLREKRAHQAAVVDAAGVVIGFITIQDVLGVFLGTGQKL